VQGERVQPEHKDMVTVYFSDIVGFTKLSSTIDSSKVTDLLARLYNKFDTLADQYEVHSLETIGDGECFSGSFSLAQSNMDALIQCPHLIFGPPNTFPAYIAVTNNFNNQSYCHASSMARFAIEAVKVSCPYPSKTRYY
jgi:class 3 adenylate cyclase